MFRHILALDGQTKTDRDGHNNIALCVHCLLTRDNEWSRERDHRRTAAAADHRLVPYCRFLFQLLLFPASWRAVLYRAQSSVDWQRLDDSKATTTSVDQWDAGTDKWQPGRRYATEQQTNFIVRCVEKIQIWFALSYITNIFRGQCLMTQHEYGQ